VEPYVGGTHPQGGVAANVLVAAASAAPPALVVPATTVGGTAVAAASNNVNSTGALVVASAPNVFNGNSNTMGGLLQSAAAVAWFDTTTIQGTSAVTGWTDKSGNGNNLALRGSGSISLLQSGALRYASWPTLAPVWLETPPIPQTFAALAFVVQFSPTLTTAQVNTTYAVAVNATPGATTDYSFRRFWQTNTASAVANSADFWYGGALWIDGVEYVVPATYSQRGWDVRGPWHVVYVQLGGGAVTNNTVSLNSIFSGRYFLGAIGELVAFSSALTTADQQRVEGALAWKFGTTAYLPANHPFAYTFPLAPLSSVQLGYSASAGGGLAASSIGAWYDAGSLQSASGSAVSGWGERVAPSTSTTLALTAASGTLSYDTTTAIAPSGTPLPCATWGASGVTSTLHAAAPPSVAALFLVVKWNAASTSGTSVALSLGAQSYTRFAQSSGAALTAADLTYNGAYYVDGGLVQSGTAFTSTIALGGAWHVVYLQLATPASGATLTLGSASAPWEGSLGEVLLLSAPLATADRQTLEGYAAWKYGTQAALVGGHPYAAAPPPATALTQLSAPLRAGGRGAASWDASSAWVLTTHQQSDVVIDLGSAQPLASATVWPLYGDGRTWANVELDGSVDGVRYTTYVPAQPVPTAAITAASGFTFYGFCFRKGTRLATPRGPRAIETLRAGDVVSTLGGGTARVTATTGAAWDTRAAPDMAAVRIPRGVLGATADLYVSLRHGVLHEGAVVPAARVPGAERLPADGVVDYCHVRIDDQSALLLAEGVPAESLRDPVVR
jgi:hypothetical protein